MLDDAGLDTGIDLDALLAIGPMLADLVGHGLPSRLAAGPCRSLKTAFSSFGIGRFASIPNDRTGNKTPTFG